MHTTIEVKIVSDNTEYTEPSEWRSLGAKHKARNIQNLAKQIGLDPHNVLEVGAGDGAILRRLSTDGFGKNLYAVEVSGSGVDVIRRGQIERLISCTKFDGYHLPFDDNYFDLVVLSHVLEHVEYERALLREIKRVSRYQIIEIPMDWTGLNNSSNFLMWQSYGHINAHSPASLRFLLSTEGLLVMADLLQLFPRELAEFDFYVNNCRDRSFRNRFKFWRISIRNRMEHTLRRKSLSERAASYTILTQTMFPAEKSRFALAIAQDFIGQGRPNIAVLIANQFLARPGDVIAVDTVSEFLEGLRNLEVLET